MYICGICKTQTKSGIPCNVMPTETRTVTYPARYDVGDPGGSGVETVREVFACPNCKEK